MLPLLKSSSQVRRYMSSSLSGLWMMLGTTCSTSMSEYALEKFKSAFESGTVLAVESDAKEVER